jgi:hypothetical protein
MDSAQVYTQLAAGEPATQTDCCSLESPVSLFLHGLFRRQCSRNNEILYTSSSRLQHSRTTEQSRIAWCLPVETPF